MYNIDIRRKILPWQDNRSEKEEAQLRRGETCNGAYIMFEVSDRHLKAKSAGMA